VTQEGKAGGQEGKERRLASEEGEGQWVASQEGMWEEYHRRGER